jgi:hypothetical protein
MSEWRCRNSARGDREHCIRITTVRQKNQCFRAIGRARACCHTRCRVFAKPAAHLPKPATQS